MLTHDLVALANGVAAIACAVIAVVTWRRRALNQTFAVALTFVMVGGLWWSVALAVVVAAPSPTAVGIATLVTFPGPSVLVTAFMCLGLTLARPQWVPQRWMIVLLLVEPVLITVAGATNPWHLLVYRGPGAAQLTTPADWTYGPIFWLDSAYGYAVVVVGLVLVAWAWWRAAPAFRTQRLAVLVAALVPLVANAAFLAGGFHDAPDPTPIGFAVTGTIMWWAIFRRDLFTFSPVARALIVDQIGDAVIVISPGGRVLDVNPAATALVRDLDPHAPDQLVGASAAGLFGRYRPETPLGTNDIVVRTSTGRAEYHVQASPLIDRRHRDLGTVFVARDVTDVNAVMSRLAEAHSQLVQQVKTIDALRADLVELASRDHLTGLHNRRHLVERFADMLHQAQATGSTFAVALFDADNFKSINDDFGHLAGDAMLVALAGLIRDLAPADALVARWGGEEFFVALPGSDETSGLAFAEELRARCAQSTIVAATGTIRCTISGGVAAFPKAGTTVDELFHAADVALYAAKNAGRNTVRLPASTPR
ncbi:MAG: diguanylate cyclase [Cellulomonas sp.]